MTSEALRGRVPLWAAPSLRAVKREAAIARELRVSRECPVCGNRVRFIVVNSEGGRHETLCMRCGSLERHRRGVLILRRATNLHDPGRRRLAVLHVAPERGIRSELERVGNIDYLTGDLDPRDVDVRIDLTGLPFAQASFDVVLCSHVLEHIPADLAAMAEMRRVLRPDGWALINVPSDPGRTTTYEDAAITGPAERLRHFGQIDHVRIYSQHDVAARLRTAGFEVTADPLEFSARERRRHMLDGDVGWDHAYLCRPRA